MITAKCFVFRFSDVEVHEDELRATRAGQALEIEPKAFRVLVYLLKHAGHLVSKSELMDAVWGETAVTENSLTRAVALLRRVLEDDPHQPHFIETVSTAGYRFICPVVNEESSASPQLAELAASPGAAEPTLRTIPGVAKPRSWLHRWRRALVRATSAFLLCATALLWYATQPLPPPHITHTVRLTSDARYEKFLFGADAARVYMYLSPSAFGQVPVSGGDITIIPVNIPNLGPTEEHTLGPLSPDGSSFLAWGHLDPADQLRDRWVVGISGSPTRLLTRGWNAAWSADGKQVIYTNPKKEILTIPSAGGEPHLLRVIDGGSPGGFAYSPDGTRIRFHWGNLKIGELSSDGSSFREILAGWHPNDGKCCGVWTPDGDFFLFMSESSPQRVGFPGYQLWVLDERHAWLRKPAPAPVQLTFGPMMLDEPVPSRDGRDIFVKGTTLAGELVRYNQQTKQLEPFLGGISADSVDFSRDGKYVVYSPFPGDILVRANRDGTGVQQIARAMLHPTNSRWSPDGSQIAYLDASRTSPIAAYVVPSQGGSPVRVLPDNHCCNESDPTWSPDGKRLALWVESPDKKTETELKIIDVSTHQISNLPSPPKRTWSPRWSPDGRYILCVTNPYPTADGLEVYDFETNKWKIILTEPGPGWPTWSKDSRSIYYVQGTRWSTFRISVDGGRSEPVVDIPGFRATGWLWGWFGLDLDDNPIMLRDKGTNEIYALTLERK